MMSFENRFGLNHALTEIKSPGWSKQVASKSFWIALLGILTFFSIMSAKAAEVRPPFLTMEDQRRCIGHDAVCLKWIYQKALISRIVQQILTDRGFEQKTAYFIARDWDAFRYDFETGAKILPKSPMLVTTSDAVAFANRIPQCLSDINLTTCQIRFAPEYGCNLQRDYIAICRRGFARVKAKFSGLLAEGRNYSATFGAEHEFYKGVACLYGPNGGDIAVFDAGPAATVTKLKFDANAEAGKLNVAGLAQRVATPASAAVLVAPAVTPAPACKAVVRAGQWRGNDELSDGQALPEAVEVLDTNEAKALQRKNEPVPNDGADVPPGSPRVSFNDLPDSWLGMELGPIEDLHAPKTTLPRAPVIYVAPNGAAAQAGIQRGDFILRIGGRAVDDAMYLRLHMTEAPVGKPMNVLYQRDGKSTTVAIKAIDLDEAARLNDVAALRHLGDFYAFQPGNTETNVRKARSYYEKAAAQSDVRAIVRLGNSFSIDGPHRDDAEARKWFEKAASLGHVSSIRLVGNMHRTGEGGSKDIARAREWLEKGAEKGDIAQMYDIAETYRNEQKYSEARKWWERIIAAEKGPLRKEGDLFRNQATFQLASAMLNGIGGPRDLVEGRKLLEKVASAGEQELIESGYILGKLLSAGEFGAPDFVKARFWYERAAKQGNADAMFALGMMYHEGIGIPKNSAEARKWIASAADNKHEGARKELQKLPPPSGPQRRAPAPRPAPP
jgi:TPR repeat protein